MVFLLKLNKIVIPTQLSRNILADLHESHMGINRTQNLARTCVFWPGINNDIVNIVNSCKVCQQNQRNKSKEPLIPHEVVDLPWYKLGIDLFEFEKEHYILILDYYSKYVEIVNLRSNTTTTNVIRHVKSILARHGLSKYVVADNGPQFRSQEFSKFLEEWNIKRASSSPYHPESNGLAERNIQTFKNMLEKCKLTRTDPYLAMLNFRTTPNSLGTSPSQLLMSRLLRTKLPMLNKNLRPRIIDRKAHKLAIEKQQQNVSAYFNKRAKNYPDFKDGENIYFKKSPDGKWLHGKVKSKADFPRAYLIQDNLGSIFRKRGTEGA